MGLRKQYTKLEREHILHQWELSNLGLSEFSRQSEVALSSLRYWVYRTNKKSVSITRNRKYSQPPASFMPVAFQPEPALEIILEFPQGTRMTIRGAVDVSYLKSLVG